MAQFNIADIIAIIIVVSLVIWGIKKGFVKAVFSLGSLLISLILSLVLYPPVTNFLAGSVVGDFVRLNVIKILGGEAASAPAASGDTSGLNLPEIFGTAIRQAETTAKETLANAVADLALTLLGIIVVFILVKILLFVVLKFLNVVTKLPLIRTANKLLGGAVGAVYGILVIYLLLALLTFVTTMSATNLTTKIVQESSLVSVMYDNNILLNFLK